MNSSSNDSNDTKDPNALESTPLLLSHSTPLQGRASSYSSISTTSKRRIRAKISCRISRYLEKPTRGVCSSSMFNYVPQDNAQRLNSLHMAESSSCNTYVEPSGLACEDVSEAWKRLAYTANYQRRSSFLSHKLKISFPEGISMTLQNSGSVARDHLASERTFLAYIRTSLAIVSSGVALVQLFTAASAVSPQHPLGSAHRLHCYIRPLGATTIVMGLIVLFIGVARYFTVQVALVKGYFPVARLLTGFIAFAMASLVTMTFSMLIAGKLELKGTARR